MGSWCCRAAPNERPIEANRDSSAPPETAETKHKIHSLILALLNFKILCSFQFLPFVPPLSPLSIFSSLCITTSSLKHCNRSFLVTGDISFVGEAKMTSHSQFPIEAPMEVTSCGSLLQELQVLLFSVISFLGRQHTKTHKAGISLQRCIFFVSHVSCSLGQTVNVSEILINLKFVICPS